MKKLSLVLFLCVFSLILAGCRRQQTTDDTAQPSTNTEVLTPDEVMSTVEPSAFGKIQGKLSYPSEGVPIDMVICAQRKDTSQNFCTNDHIITPDQPTTYQLEVPAGSYEVYAYVESSPQVKAYYSEFVTCGLLASCPSHKRIEVAVQGGATLNNIDPGDWYVPSGEELEAPVSDPAPAL